MARIRTIKPEFWTSEQVTECSPTARLMFIGLWNFCDDGGRMPCSPKNIKMRIFPADDISSESIRRMIDELSSSGLVSLYEYENRQYLQVTGWKHQKIDRPTFQFPDHNGVIPSSTGFGNRRALDEASTPEGSLRESNGRESKGGESIEGAHAPSSRARAPPRFADWPSDYRAQFAAKYPHNVGMAAAFKCLDKVRGTVSWAVVMDGLATYAAKTDTRQWANPKTWIEQERWNDRPAPAGNGRTHVTDADLAAELAREAGERRRSAQASGGEAQRGGGLPAGGGDAQLPGAPGRRTG